MATVTGLTAERMLEIEAQCIVAGAVVLNDLILTKHDGSTINAGNVRGSQGIQGIDGDIGPDGPKGVSWYNVTADLVNISGVSGSAVGDYFVNTDTANHTILGVAAVPPGGVVKSTSATAGTQIGSIRGPQGTAGAAGTAGVTPRGPYIDGIAYAVNDIVTAEGSTYRAKNAIAAGLGTMFGVTPDGRISNGVTIFGTPHQVTSLDSGAIRSDIWKIVATGASTITIPASTGSRYFLYDAAGTLVASNFGSFSNTGGLITASGNYWLRVVNGDAVGNLGTTPVPYSVTVTFGTPANISAITLPGADPTNWEVLAAKGADGTAGGTGPSGIIPADGIRLNDDLSSLSAYTLSGDVLVSTGGVVKNTLTSTEGRALHSTIKARAFRAHLKLNIGASPAGTYMGFRFNQVSATEYCAAYYVPSTGAINIDYINSGGGTNIATASPGVAASTTRWLVLASDGTGRITLALYDTDPDGVTIAPLGIAIASVTTAAQARNMIREPLPIGIVMLSVSNTFSLDDFKIYW